MTLIARAIYFWRGLAAGSTNRRIFSAIVVITAATVAVKLAAVVKDIMVAGTFGLGDALDAFLIALVVPSLVSGLVGYSFIGAFMPAFVRARENGGLGAAQRLFSNVIALNFAVLAVLALVLGIAGLPLLKLLAAQFPAEKLALTHELYLLLLAAAVLDSQSLLWGSVLNAGEKFALVALAPILSPVLMIAALVMLPGLDIAALAWAAVTASATELTILGVVLARRGLIPVPRWNSARSEAIQVVRQCFPLMLGAVFTSAAGIVDQSMASWLGSGSVSAVNFGNKVPAFLCGIGVTALGTAVLPHFSRLAAAADYQGLRHTLRTYTQWILLISIPLTLVCILSSSTIVRLLFERGAFGADDTAVVAFVQQMYFIQVPFMVLAVLGSRFLVAMGRNQLLTIMSAICLVLNVVGNLILMRWMGVAGIALATSLMYVASVSMIFVVSRRVLRSAHGGVAP